MNVWTVDQVISVVVMDLKNQAISVRKVTTVLKGVKPMYQLHLIINVLLVIIVLKEVLPQCHVVQVYLVLSELVYVMEKLPKLHITYDDVFLL